MSLVHSVLDFVERARSRPVRASDPDELRSLERAARGSWENSFVAQHAPVSEYTFEGAALLPSAAQTSERILLSWVEPTEIIGFYPTLVVPVGVVGLRMPTLDEVQVQLDLEDGRTYLTRSSSASVASAKQGNFCSISSIGIQAPRLFALRLTGVKPELGVTFRWKLGANIHPDTIVTLTAFCRALTGRRL